jgi:TonB-dependent starch-binding outer membrane protein SusC
MLRIEEKWKYYVSLKIADVGCPANLRWKVFEGLHRTIYDNVSLMGSLKAGIVLLVGISTLIVGPSYAQTHIVTGHVVGSDDNNPLTGVHVFIKNNITKGAVTGLKGDYSISVPSDSSLLVYSYIGYVSVTENAGGRGIINVALTPEITTLNEIVVTGYGTQAQKDLTGAVSSVKEKDFNRGNFVSPDQLIQGRVAGVQITNSSGQPGVAATIKIRGNSVLTGTGQPLFVVDGVPLSGATARPNTDDFGDTSPAGNPLNFLNPSDIVSMDVLKDASAAAIYGSRAAYGVIIITTKKAQTGEPKIDFAFSAGLASIQHKVNVLDASQYRDAIKYYGVDPSNDKGGNSDGLSSILRTGKQQNYSVGISGGSANGKYRLSLGYYDQEGIIAKSEIKKYNASFTTNLRFLDSKKLGMDVSLLTSQYIEAIPLLRNAGNIRNGGSIVGDALAWNPTDSLRKSDGSLKILSGFSNQNPLALSEYYNDNSKVTTVLASISPYYEFTDWLVFKMLASINYGSGVRRNSVNQAIDTQNHVGSANIYNNENSTSQITNTLTFHRDILPRLNLTAIAGFEYMNFTAKGSSIGVSGPFPAGFGTFGLDYTNYIQYSNQINRVVSSSINPSTELQSFFGRTVFNYKSKYLLTATFRADGSTKFGKNNKYGYFPSFSVGWVASEEDFFTVDFIDFLKLRAGWGKTGNQEFPSGSSATLYGFLNNGSLGQINNPNPNLKWQADEQFNVGVDFTILKNKISGTLDYFQKITTDLLYPNYPIQPAPPGTVVSWTNLDGKIRNTGLEASVRTSIIDHTNFGWDFGLNATFLQNNVSGLKSPLFTGSLDGRGMSGVTVQEIQNGTPMNSFYTRKFQGIDPATGLSVYQDNGYTFFKVGNPNPTKLLGINSTFRYKRLSLAINMYGAFGQSIYNNTLNSTLNVGNINVGQNIALSVYQNPVKESLFNPVEPSSRFIERGDYLRMSNASLTYNLHNIGKAFKQARIYITGQNLFTVTNYSGFNPEINIDKSVNGVPSLAIDYQAYPSARTIILGVNFSL